MRTVTEEFFCLALATLNATERSLSGHTCDGEKMLKTKQQK